MPLALKDRVRETSNTAGTGTLTLGGAVPGFQSFSVIGNANTTYYAIVDVNSGSWEVGLGTYTASGTTLSRDAVLESSAGGVRVNFTASIKDVFCTYPAEQAVTLDDVQTLTNKTISSPALTGTPTAPTAAANTNTTQLATTAHVFAERANTATLTNKTLTGAVLNGTLGATTPSTVAATTVTATGAIQASSAVPSMKFTGITSETKKSTDLIETYPDGYSMTAVNGGAGWPLGATQGVLETFYTTQYGADGIGFSYQRFTIRNGSAHGNRRLFHRYPSNTAALAPWTDWLETAVIHPTTGLAVTGRITATGTVDLSNNAIRTDASGNTSIGAGALPNGRLTVFNNSSDLWASVGSGLALNGGGDSEVSTITTFYDATSIRIGAGVSTKTGILIAGQTASGGNFISARVGNAERLRIDAAGNLGLGTTTPTERLDVVGNIRQRARYSGSFNGSTATSVPMTVIDLAAFSGQRVGGRIKATGNENGENNSYTEAMFSIGALPTSPFTPLVVLGVPTKVVQGNNFGNVNLSLTGTVLRINCLAETSSGGWAVSIELFTL